MQRKNAGFTLIELMLVMAIIAVLAAIIMPAFMRAREQAKFVACKSIIRAVVTAMEMYRIDNPGPLHDNLPDPQDWSFLVDNEYLKEQPRCPSDTTKNETSSYCYTLIHQPSMGTIGYHVDCLHIRHIILGHTGPAYTFDGGFTDDYEGLGPPPPSPDDYEGLGPPPPSP